MLKKGKLLYPELSYLIYGFCYKIHNELGRYRNERQYADAFENFLKKNRIKYERELKLLPSFGGEKTNRNIPDFVVDDKTIVDFKAKRVITKEDYYQMKRYLASLQKELGLIINFRDYYLKPKRILNPKSKTN